MMLRNRGVGVKMMGLMEGGSASFICEEELFSIRQFGPTSTDA
jgi:hypothetical protein